MDKSPSIGSTATPTARKFLSVREACEELTISRPTFEKLWRAGTIRTLKLSGRRLVAAAELDRLAALATGGDASEQGAQA